MTVPDDNKLDALLRRAAPDGAPPGFADAVLDAASARRRARRLRAVALGVAAAVALALGLGAVLSRSRPARPAQVTRVRTAETRRPEPAPEAEEPGSFAVQLVSTGETTHRVMMARINGTYVISARPNDEMADELEELLRLPAAMVGSLSSAAGGASMAVLLK